MLEVDDALRQSQRTVENLNRIKEVVVAQQHALAEQRARLVKGDYYEDDYSGLHEDYKGSGGFSGGDAKKRRGVCLTHHLHRYTLTTSLESCTARPLS